jgi:ABC-type sugar transport system substrate-binding protein
MCYKRGGKYMKKIILIIIAVLMLVTPMACSSQESESSVNNASNSEQGEIRIAWVNPTIGHPLYNMQDEGALLAAKEYGVTVDILGTSGGIRCSNRNCNN